MKKILCIFSCILVFLTGCSEPTDKVTISTDKTLYSQSVLSDCGVVLTPVYETTREPEESLIYKWSSNSGTFKTSKKTLDNYDTILENTENTLAKLGEAPVTFTLDNNDASSTENDSIEIELTVTGFESRKELATTKLTLTCDNGIYTIKE